MRRLILIAADSLELTALSALILFIAFLAGAFAPRLPSARESVGAYARAASPRLSSLPASATRIVAIKRLPIETP